MNNYIKALIVTVILAGLVAGGFYLHDTQSPVKAAGIGPASTYLTFGLGFGITQNPSSFPLTVATTTVCTITSPAATSTLRTAGVTFTTSTTTASLVTLARSIVGGSATTTLLGNQIAVAAGAQATIVASTTASQQGVADVFPPSTNLVVGMQGNPGTFSPVGRCWAEFDTYSL